MADNILAAVLKQRIQLWRRIRRETEEGDIEDRWLPVTWVWAKICMHTASDSDDQQAMKLEVIMRPTPYQFHGMSWKGKSYKLISGLLENPENHTIRCFVRNIPAF